MIMGCSGITRLQVSLSKDTPFLLFWRHDQGTLSSSWSWMLHDFLQDLPSLCDTWKVKSWHGYVGPKLFTVVHIFINYPSIRALEASPRPETHREGRKGYDKEEVANASDGGLTMYRYKMDHAARMGDRLGNVGAIVLQVLSVF